MRKILVTFLILIGLGSFSFITYAKPKADSGDGVTATESSTKIIEKKEKADKEKADKEKKGTASREHRLDGKDSRKKGKEGNSSRGAS